MKKVLPLMKKYRVYAILSPIFMILEVIADVVIPFLMAKIVNEGINNRDIDYIVKVGIAMVVAAVLAMIFGIASSHCGARAGHGFASEIRNKTFKKIQGFSFSNLDDFTVSSLITRLTNDCNTIGQVTMMSLRMGIRAPSMFIFALIMAIILNPKVAILFAIAIPVMTVAIFIILKKSRPLFLKLQSRVDRVNAIIQENLTGIRVVKSFNRQEHEEKRFEKRNDRLRDTSLKAISLVLMLMPFLNLVIYSLIIAILWFGGKEVVAGSLGGGDLMALITYISQVMMSIIIISMFFMQFLRGSASMQRINEVLDKDSEIQEIDDKVYEVKDGSIIFKDVSFSYYDNKDYILKDIDFSIKSGETLGIIGSTGSSKSSLVQLIPRLYDVSEGAVLVGGVDVRDYDMKALRDQVAFVLQKNTLFSGTIRENMRWGKDDATDEEIITALKHSQAWEFVSEYEDGLDHRVEQGGDNFSGGQKQRLTIARALLKDPKVIILDDSTSAVDMTTDAKIQHAFKEELSHVTTIIIAQRVASIKEADRILVLHEGQIESIGDHETLIKSSPIYREIHDSQEKGVIGE